ncbi:MAG: hypothetical protein D3923_13580, partial [Candidatus Electrothrix sp. AR3]|nr:hypothetical protein [Candidatus Electrothrix sp. AR3]
SSMRFNVNLDDYPASSYPRDFYARYETDEGGWAWAGPITVSKIGGQEASGSITAPGGTSQGDLTVSCNASAPAGLKEVSVYFGNNDLPVVMCKDGTSNPCPSTSGSWTENNVNPLDHGVSGAGEFKMGLYVKDDDGNFNLVDIHPVIWSPDTPSSGPSGSITSPGSSAQGHFTVSCNAEDSAGLDKVSVVFVPNGTPLVMCDDSTGNPCSGSSDSWMEANINPLDYGVTGDGSFTLGLWVRNEAGDPATLVDSQTVNWTQEQPSGLGGSITSPGSIAEGDFTVSCNAAASAGLHEVSIYFGNNNLPVVMCKDGTSTPCPSTSGSWTETNVNPLDHGVSGAGEFKMGLYVKDDDGTFDLVDIHPVTWSAGAPPVNTPPSGSFTAPSGLVNGLVTIRATASDADGLKKVSAVFVPNGTPLVLCDDASSHACSGSNGSWEVAGINPADYDVAAGNIILGLHVQDETDGNTETLAASTEFTWIPPNNQFPKNSKYFNVCVGHNYEQQMPLEGTTMPSVSFTDAPTSIRSGENVTLHTNGFVDTANGGSPFYYYCTRQG